MNNSKIKVLIISEPGSGGVKRHVIDLLNNLDKDKFDIIYAYSKKRASDDYLMEVNKLKDKIFCQEIRYMQQPISIKNDSLAFVEIFKLINYINPNIVHCHSSKAGVLGRVAAKLLKVSKIIYTPHAYAFQNSNLSNLKKRFYLLVEKVLAQYCTTKTINVSYGEMKIAIDNEIDKKEKFIVIPNGIDKKEYKINKDDILKKLKITKNQIIVGNVARLDNQKNPLEFLKIAEIINEHNKKFKFFWIGNGILLKECQSYIEQHKLENVCLLPFNTETEKLITVFNIFLCTSLYEGYPYVLLDANANKIPIVATDVTGNNEIVKDNTNGFLYTIGDISKAVKIIEQYDIWKNNLHFHKLDSIGQMINKIQNLYLME